MSSMTFDPVLYLQIRMARLYRKRHGSNIGEFLELDKKVDFLMFIEECYEPFHLTGDEGILDEIDKYCGEQLAQ